MDDDLRINVRPDRQGIRLTVSASDVVLGGVLTRTTTTALVEAMCESAGLPKPWKQR